MARTALKVKCDRQKKEREKALSEGKKVKFSARIYNRCQLCGRSRGYMRKFKMCRICFRELARKGEITGIKKCSW